MSLSLKLSKKFDELKMFKIEDLLHNKVTSKIN